MNIDAIRDAVAQELQSRGIGDRAFYEEIREGRRDDSPFMIGALAWAERGKVDCVQTTAG